MGAIATRRWLLLCAATDSTFELLPVRAGEPPVWEGRCLHCGRKHRLARDGAPITRATVEHIVPRHHGGGDEPHNLAIACAACNLHKGRRHDVRAWADPQLQALLTTLQARRLARWRPPHPEAALPEALLAGLALEHVAHAPLAAGMDACRGGGGEGAGPGRGRGRGRAGVGLASHASSAALGASRGSPASNPSSTRRTRSGRTQ